MTNSIRPKYLTIKQAYEYAGVSRTRLYENLYRLKARKCGERTLVLFDALDAWMETWPVAKAKHPRRS
jgi:hypothetical protein